LPKASEGRGYKVIIAGAGGAAHLPGMLAAMTRVARARRAGRRAGAERARQPASIVQMPGGVPVGTLAIGKAGAANAALLAAAMIATTDPALAARLDAWRAAQSDAVAETVEDPNRCSLNRSPPAPRSGSSAPASSGACWPWPRRGWACARGSTTPRPIRPPAMSRRS
jgi:5-(carboxyamino)imidazole ribonucleotide mutase